MEELRREKEALEDKLDKIHNIWERAFEEFRHVRESLREEIEAHEQTKQRLAHQQQLVETVTRVASAGVDEFNQLKRQFAAEQALRKDYEQRLGLAPSATPSNSQEEIAQKAMKDNISNVYLIPTLTELGERLERAETELAAATQRANTAESNLERIQAAAVAAMEEFYQLKKKYAEEMARRQEAEKVAMELNIKQGELKDGGKANESIEQLKKQVETERQLRKLAENDVANITKQLNEKNGRQFDLMTLTELECKLESAQKSLEFNKELVQKLEQEKDALQREVAALQTRAGIVTTQAPPPPPPPPIFTTVPTTDNLKKRIGVLKTKLQRDEKDDQLTDLRAQAMEELQQKLQKRKQTEEKKADLKETGQLANLANILQQTQQKPESMPPGLSPQTPQAPRSSSRRELTSLDDVILGLEKEFDWINTK